MEPEKDARNHNGNNTTSVYADATMLQVWFGTWLSDILLHAVRVIKVKVQRALDCDLWV